jgi:acetyl esterase/lipase
MSDLIEYIVIVHNIEDKQALHDEIINLGGSECVPDREVDCCLNPTTSRNTHYMMTEAEAELIKQDPRVWDVSRTWQDLGLSVGHFNVSYSQISNHFSKGNTQASTDVNWALLQVLEGQNRFQWGNDSPIQLFDVAASITVPFSGKNVDIVVVDGHADPAHPEFAVNADGTGGSRYNQINWLAYTNAIFNGTNGTYVYTPYGGTAASAIDSLLEANNNHGTHVASSCAGNQQGWARSANIYNIGFGFPDSNPTNSTTNAYINSYFFQYVKYWHQNKTVNPSTGTRNPTICTNSWGYTSTVPRTDILAVNYQGTLYQAPAGGFSAAQLATYGIPCFDGTNCSVPARYTPMESQITDLINAGVIMIGAAGNNGAYIARDTASSTDNNYFNSFLASGGNTYYYCRGSTPSAVTGVINVGALDASYTTAKTYFSNCGPRVDVYSPGYNITGAFSTFAGLSYEGYPQGVADPRNSGYSIGKVPGTSQATPQVAGLVACLLEAFPTAGPADALSYITATAKTGQMVSGQFIYNGFDYSSIQGGNNRVLYASFPNSPVASVALSTVSVKTGSQVKFTPVIGSGGVGQLTYTISPNLPTGTTFQGWIESIPGNTSYSFFHVTSSNSSSIQQGDSISGSGVTQGSFLEWPTDASKTTWTIRPGYSANVGSAGSPISINNGFHINSLTGEITGRVSNVLGLTTYSVTVTGNNISTSASFNLRVNTEASPTVTTEVPYGTDLLQRCDIYQQTGVTPQGVIIWVHGGGWSGGAKSPYGFNSSQGGYWINDYDQINQLAKQGYIVVNCNYRLATAGTDYIPSGGTTNNYHPAGAADIETIIQFCTVANAGSSYSALWNQIVNAVNTYGLIISGASAGGHLVAFAGMKYINDYGNNKITAICPIVGPTDLDWVTLNDTSITQTAKDIVDNYVNSASPVALQAASPRYIYGSDSSPGYVHNAVKNSTVKWIFINNLNDTLVPPALTDNFINTLQAELGNNRVTSIKLNEGSKAYTEINHNLASPISVLVETAANLAFGIVATIAISSKQVSVGSSTTFTPVTFTGGSGVKTYSISPGLPGGLNFNTSTGTISGTPTLSSQTTAYAVTATDAAGKSVSAIFTLAVLAVGGGSGAVVNHNDWNLLQTKVATVLGAPSGSTVDAGWGQQSSIVSSQISAYQEITGVEFNQIATDVDTCYQHINNTRYQPYSRSPTPPIYYLVTQADYTELSGKVDYVYSNRTTVSPTKLTNSSWTAQTGSVAFNQILGYAYQVEFANNAAFRSFWNAGGSINWKFAFGNTAGNPISQGWTDLLGNMGSFTLTKDAFYQSGQAISYPATIGFTGGVYGGNMLVAPNPIANPGITKSAIVYEADAHYTSSFFSMWVGLDNGDLFQAKSIYVIMALANQYSGTGGSNSTSSGNAMIRQILTYPFNNQPIGQTHAYNYIDGTTNYSAYYNGIEPNNPFVTGPF